MIKLENKIAKIEALTPSAFLDLVINLLTKIGYSNISKLNSQITATLVGPISRHDHQFIFIPM